MNSVLECVVGLCEPKGLCVSVWGLEQCMFVCVYMYVCQYVWGKQCVWV